MVSTVLEPNLIPISQQHTTVGTVHQWRYSAVPPGCHVPRRGAAVAITQLSTINAVCFGPDGSPASGFISVVKNLLEYP
jgi:hypothetical protein